MMVWIMVKQPIVAAEDDDIAETDQDETLAEPNGNEAVDGTSAD